MLLKCLSRSQPSGAALAWHICIFKGKFLNSDEPLQESMEEPSRLPSSWVVASNTLASIYSGKGARVGKLAPSSTGLAGPALFPGHTAPCQRCSWVSCNCSTKLNQIRQCPGFSFQALPVTGKTPQGSTSLNSHNIMKYMILTPNL